MIESNHSNSHLLAQGIEGPQGAMGIQGIEGPQGAMGLQGLKGDQGGKKSASSPILNR